MLTIVKNCPNITRKYIEEIPKLTYDRNQQAMDHAPAAPDPDPYAFAVLTPQSDNFTTIPVNRSKQVDNQFKQDNTYDSENEQVESGWNKYDLYEKTYTRRRIL